MIIYHRSPPAWADTKNRAILLSPTGWSHAASSGQSRRHSKTQFGAVVEMSYQFRCRHRPITYGLTPGLKGLLAVAQVITPYLEGFLALLNFVTERGYELLLAIYL
jgi:hypothetical protein